MGNTTAWTHKPRVISFRKSTKQTGVLVPVNDRAKKAIKPRRSVQAHELVQLDGYFKVMVYTDKGALKAIKL